MKKMSVMTTITVVAAMFILSCTKKRDEIMGDPVSVPGFMADINPLIGSSCAYTMACHGAGSVNGPGPLTSYAQIKAAAPEIKSAVVSREMPLNAPLSNADIQKIRSWVDAGAPAN